MIWRLPWRAAVNDGVIEPWGLEALDEILAIEQLAFSHPWTRGNFQDSLCSGYRCQRLRLGDETLGYHVAMRGPGEMHLLNLTVHPAHQRQGLGGRLLDNLIDHCLDEQLADVWLEVRQSHSGTQALYRSRGFEVVGVRKHYYPLSNTGREHALVMRLVLRDERAA